MLYHELLVRLFDADNPFFSMGLVRILFFCVAAGLFLFLILDLLPWRKAARIAGIVLLSLGTVYTCIEYCCKSFYKTYFGIAYVNAMAGQVVGDFFGTMVEVIVARIPFILLSFIPLVVFILFRRAIIRERGQRGSVRLLLAGMLVLCQLLGFLLSNFGGVKNFYTYEYSANASIPHFGIFTSLRLEAEYGIFGMPEEKLPDIPVGPDPSEPVPSADPSQEPTDEPTDEPTQTPVVYGYNTLDIDFAALEAAAQTDTFKAMHRYFGSLTPSQQNEYTGYFKDKNLIFLTAEAFSPYAISEELTPTLYRLSHEGFVFNNFYQPNWTMSTIGGEFANTTGIIPMWGVQGKTSYAYSKNVSMPISLAWQLQKQGYVTPAWHNHTYTYYGRDGYLTNLGYDYKGVGNGLTLPSNLWPNSDLEMMKATVDGYVDDYVNNGTKFHAYYMTVSGHCNYNWGGNAMSRKNREIAQAAYPNASEAVQAYIACNLELEYAMEYLVTRLEEAGIADDTVIVMAADHYPYGMVTDDGDFYKELSGRDDTEKDTSRYRNSLILWCGSMEEPVVVDTPCSAIDIVPTLANLFGLEYDSRLYSGRDIFAENYEVSEASTCMPLVIFANTGYGNSWITAAGTYEASTKTFTPNPGVEVDD
ncbi:MAG: sulfatase-like hydrolase/transferase, partial [Oscillospiraceae bacterium]|nr:sulfatase-like hydrolase/transferase [Oscillospiraceae bacterium]